jgi:hypothetical protein
MPVNEEGPDSDATVMITSVPGSDMITCRLPPGAVSESSDRNSMLVAEGREIVLILCSGGVLNTTCTDGGWIPSPPDQEYRTSTTDNEETSTLEDTNTTMENGNYKPIS